MTAHRNQKDDVMIALGAQASACEHFVFENHGTQAEACATEHVGKIHNRPDPDELFP
jgi:hypothetical protein